MHLQVSKAMLNVHTQKYTERAVDSNMVTHPYALFIWHAKHCVRGEPSWYEALQAFTENDALYMANLIHLDTDVYNSSAVIQVVRYGINFACFPDQHSVELCERKLAKHKQPQERITEDFEPEIIF